MRARTWRGLAAVVAALVSLASSGAVARAADDLPVPQAPDGAQEARQQYQAGMEAYQAKRFVEAALHFEAAVAQRPHAVALYTAALAWEQANRPERAADDFARALDVRGLSALQAQNARDRLTTLERAMGTLDVTAPEGWRVQLDANTGVPAPAHLHGLPGVHALTIQAQGLPIQHRDVTLDLGKVTRLELSPESSAPAPPPPPAAPPAEESSLRDRASAAPRGREILRDVGFGFVGAGVASCAAGAVLGTSALAARDAYNAAPTRSAYDHALSLQTWTDVAFIAGGVFVLGGAALALWPTSSSRSKGEPPVALVPSLGGLVVRGAF